MSLKMLPLINGDWKLRARLWDNTERYYITHLNDVHTCPKTQTYPNHRNANKKVIGHLLTPKLQDRSRVLRGKDIQQDILSEYKIHISYQQAMKGKHYGIQQGWVKISDVPEGAIALVYAKGKPGHVGMVDVGAQKNALVIFLFTIHIQIGMLP
ncbi:hypothetical protein Tco_1109693 [Tanacetum coccineum]|uniref:Uncharacterized protein n=1 Tax=Tanacetum coccineum TaxID=301880 RepID=A0ABQ5IGR1_9ASTR